MSVTLYPGSYRFVCPCGKDNNEVFEVKYKINRMEPYCWYCKKDGKFIKVMEEKINFSTNWNNKLNCNSFTTLRLRNDRKYYVGAKVGIYLKNTLKGKSTIVGVSHFTIDKINEFIARVDTGYSADECKNIIKEMYKNSTPPIDWRTKQLAFCVIVYDKRVETKDLFNN